MDEKRGIKTRLSSFLLIISIIIICVMVFWVYKLNSEKNNEKKKSADLQEQVNLLNSNSLVVKQQTSSNISKSDDVLYNITTRKGQYGDETIAVIEATEDGNTITKEFEMGAVIADTGTMVFPTIGSVALVADSGGEYCGVSIYQLINNEIEKIGTIDCGADMVEDATYSVETKEEATAVITANINGETITKEFEMSGAIEKTEVIDIFDYGKVVLVAETGGEYYAFKAYRLSKDYTNGKIKGIVEVGSIQYYF